MHLGKVLASPQWLPTYLSLITPATDWGLCQRRSAHFESAHQPESAIRILTTATSPPRNHRATTTMDQP